MRWTSSKKNSVKLEPVNPILSCESAEELVERLLRNKPQDWPEAHVYVLHIPAGKSRFAILTFRRTSLRTDPYRFVDPSFEIWDRVQKYIQKDAFGKADSSRIDETSWYWVRFEYIENIIFLVGTEPDSVQAPFTLKPLDPDSIQQLRGIVRNISDKSNPPPPERVYWENGDSEPVLAREFRFFRKLYWDLPIYSGFDAYLGEWVSKHCSENHSMSFWHKGTYINGSAADWTDTIKSKIASGDMRETITIHDLHCLYALSRTNDYLVSSRISNLDGSHLQKSEWASLLELEALEGDEMEADPLELDCYTEFWQAFGFDVVEPTKYHPFWCEIVKIELAQDPDHPPCIEEVIWPSLFISRLLFSRSGVTIRVGQNVFDKDLIQFSRLYWCFYRHHRVTNDLSVGWGHNSQWATSHRFDGVIDDKLFYNMNPCDIDPEFCDEIDDDGGEVFYEYGLTKAEMVDILKYRCLSKLAPERRSKILQSEAFKKYGFNDLLPYDLKCDEPCPDFIKHALD